MRYIVDKIFVAPDEPPSVIRKKVAQKLGVSTTAVRYNVIRRNWWRVKNGGFIELRVEAETNEFIHNTSYFPPEVKPAPSFDIHLKKRPVVIGFGLRGVIAAYLLAKHGLAPIVLENGPSILEQTGTKKKGLGEGEGGLAAYTGMMFHPDLLNNDLKDILKEDGIVFDSVDAHQYLSAAYIKSFVKKLHSTIVEKGGEVIFGAKYLGVKSRFGKVRGVLCEINGEQTLIRTDNILICNGEYDDQYYLGICIESSSRYFNQFVYGKALPDAKLPSYYAESSFTTKNGDQCVFMTGLGKATLLDIGAPKQRMKQVLDFGQKGRNVLSYLGVRVSEGELEKIVREGYVASKPGFIPYDTVGDFLYHRDPLKLGSVKPYNVTQVHLTSLNKLLGSKISTALETALKQFGKAFPYILQEDALVGGVVELSGNSDPESADFLAKGLYFAPSSPTKCIDFASAISAGYRVVCSLCAHV